MEDCPPFLKEYFRGIADNKTPGAMLAYAYDLRIFFEFLHKEEKMPAPPEWTLAHLKAVTMENIENFLYYTSYYQRTYASQNDKTYTLERANSAKTKSRKLSSLRAMFNYFIKREKLDTNPAKKIDMPKIRQKNIVYLEANEVTDLLNQVETGSNLTHRQQKYHQITKRRDMAIFTLLLGTGIRISECVGIDINHIDFNTNKLKVVRKGGDEDIVFFGKEVKEALLNYLEEREKKNPVKGYENALFLSGKNRRITPRAVQNLVKKYTKLISTKTISPHKLRSTFGTHLYRETGDLYLVAEMLGHKDVNTTKKHYASLGEEKKRKAAELVKLRED